MHQGSCLCGSIRYEIDSDLEAIVNCHCRFCRKAHGAPFITLLFMPAARFTVLQGAELIGKHHIESLNADRCFCTKCGTRLYNDAPSRGMMSIVVATLDVDEAPQVRAHINTGSKSASYRISDGLPQFAGMPAPAQFQQWLASELSRID